MSDEPNTNVEPVAPRARYLRDLVRVAGRRSEAAAGPPRHDVAARRIKVTGERWFGRTLVGWEMVKVRLIRPGALC